MKRFAALTSISLALFLTLCTGIANAIPLQALLDGGSLRVGSWLVKDWSIDWRDYQIPGSTYYVDSNRNFNNVDVTGAASAEHLSVYFDWDGNYWVNGFSLTDNFRFTLQSLNPFFGITTVDNIPASYILEGEDNATVASSMHSDDEHGLFDYQCWGYRFSRVNNTTQTTGNSCGADFLWFYPSAEVVLEHHVDVGSYAGRVASLTRSGFYAWGEFQSTPVRADEPATVGVLGFGLIGLFLAARRRKTL